MQQNIESLRHSFEKDVEAASTSSAIEALKVKYLGRKGPIQQLMQSLRDVSPEERPSYGKKINDIKEEIAKAIETRMITILEKEDQERLINETIDVTLPGRSRFMGRKHVITQALDEILEILKGMGFSVQDGPDIDTDYYNFEALNFSHDHPARDMQDTFYLGPNVLLRTHTSNIQARIMESERPPIRIVAPGRAYRNETITARSHVFFHQVEAVYVDRNVTFSDLMSTLDEFLPKLFGEAVTTRFRPSYFPFVEPGMEVDVSCLSCKGNGCALCKHTGWLEILGAGMIHPEVLKNCDIDPEEYSGYAWGMGVERLVLLKYGVNDIRLFTQNDMRFLQQFSSV